MQPKSLFSWAALRENWGELGALSPWTLLPERCFVGNRERGLIPLAPGVLRDGFGDPHSVLGIQEEQGSSPHAWECGGAAPRQALPLPGSCFFIFVTILKPAARLGN